MLHFKSYKLVNDFEINIRKWQVLTNYLLINKRKHFSYRWEPTV